MSLTLATQAYDTNDQHARIAVFRNGARIGTLTVETEHASEVADWIKSHARLLQQRDKLRKACQSAAALLANGWRASGRVEFSGKADAVRAELRAALADCDAENKPAPNTPKDP